MSLEDLNDKMIELSAVKGFYRPNDSEFEINEMYSEKIDAAIFAMESRINFCGITVGLPPPGRVHETNTKAKLPKVELPTFSG